MVKQIRRLRLHRALHLFISLHLPAAASAPPDLQPWPAAPALLSMSEWWRGVISPNTFSHLLLPEKKSLGTGAEPERPGCRSGLNKNAAVSVMEKELFSLWTCQSEPGSSSDISQSSCWEAALWWCIVPAGCGVSPPNSGFMAHAHTSDDGYTLQTRSNKCWDGCSSRSKRFSGRFWCWIRLENWQTRKAKEKHLLLILKHLHPDTKIYSANLLDLGIYWQWKLQRPETWASAAKAAVCGQSRSLDGALLAALGFA